MIKKTVLLFIFIVCSFKQGYAQTLPTAIPASAGPVDEMITQVHAGTAWEAYNRGDLLEAERQFFYLIQLADQTQVETITENRDENRNRNRNGNRNGNGTKLQTGTETQNLKLGLAYTYTKLEKFIAAKGLFEELIQNNYQLTDCVPAMLDTLSRLKRYDIMEPYLALLETLFEKEKLKQWDYIRVELAWDAYHGKNYQTAENRFTRLVMDNPYDTTLIIGLGYAFYQQGKYDAAYDLLQGRTVENTPELAELEQILYRRMADEAMKILDEPIGRLTALPQKKKDQLNRAYTISRLLLDRNSTYDMAIMIIARVDYEKGMISHAISFLQKRFEALEFNPPSSPPASALARQLLLFLNDSGQRDRAWDFIVSLSQSRHRELKNIAADYFANTGRLVPASWALYPDHPENNCYANAWAPEINGVAYYRVKDGDDGSSQLEERSFLYRYREALSVDGEWGFFLKARDVSVGNAWEVAKREAAKTREIAGVNGTEGNISINGIEGITGITGIFGTGSAYRNLNGDSPQLLNDDDERLYEAWFHYKKEGPFTVEIAMGTSPMGGVIGATPALTVTTRYHPWSSARAPAENVSMTS